ncbi:MAG: hypothetical protein WCN95_11375 [bacterium]
MTRTVFRLLTCGVALAGFASLVFLPPMYVGASHVKTYDLNTLPSYVVIDVAWCVAIAGTVFGLGLGLFVGSFLNLKTNRRPEPENE